MKLKSGGMPKRIWLPFRNKMLKKLQMQYIAWKMDLREILRN
jgi:hypothetical protein